MPELIQKLKKIPKLKTATKKKKKNKKTSKTIEDVALVVEEEKPSSIRLLAGGVNFADVRENSSHDISTDISDDHEGSLETLGPVETEPLDCNRLRILDYLRFKAARTIQRHARGWYTRRMMKKRNEAAITIQKNWRRFSAQRKYFGLVENMLQERIVKFHSDSATKIQALWRGHWVRENIHDQYRLKRSQKMAAEDLLHCIAFKLHHLLRTHQIPGIYSLRNSTALSRVEKLLVSISFKQHNHLVSIARLRRIHELGEPAKKFKESTFGTVVPYSGPNFLGLCEPKCCPIYKERDIDKRIHHILSLYEQAGQDERIRKFREERKLRLLSIRVPPPPPNFCCDLIQSMQRWNILAPNQKAIDPGICHRPEQLEKFLQDMHTIYEEMQDRGGCNIRLADLPPACKNG